MIYYQIEENLDVQLMAAFNDGIDVFQLSIRCEQERFSGGF